MAIYEEREIQASPRNPSHPSPGPDKKSTEVISDVGEEPRSQTSGPSGAIPGIVSCLNQPSWR